MMDGESQIMRIIANRTIRSSRSSFAERSLDGLGGRLETCCLIALIFLTHGGGELDEMIHISAFRQLGFDVVFAAAQDHGTDAFAQPARLLQILGRPLSSSS